MLNELAFEFNFQWVMREYYNCHQQCAIGLCSSACGLEGFCYFSENKIEDNSVAIVPESLEKQSLIINSKRIQSSESKCFRPGKVFVLISPNMQYN